MQTIYYGSKGMNADCYHMEYDDFGEYWEDSSLIAADEDEDGPQFLVKYGKIA